MFGNWFSQKISEQTIGHQATVEILKALITFTLLIVVTRWTLSRADRKDVIARMVAATLDLQKRRIDLLAEMIVRVSELADLSTKISRESLDESWIAVRSQHEPRIRELLSEVQLLGERYGESPPECLGDSDIRTEHSVTHLGEALRRWGGKYIALMFNSTRHALYFPPPDEDEAVKMAANEAIELRGELRKLLEHEEALLVDASGTGRSLSIRRANRMSVPLCLLLDPWATRNMHLVKRGGDKANEQDRSSEEEE